LASLIQGCQTVAVGGCFNAIMTILSCIIMCQLVPKISVLCFMGNTGGHSSSLNRVLKDCVLLGSKVWNDIYYFLPVYQYVDPINRVSNRWQYLW